LTLFLISLKIASEIGGNRPRNQVQRCENRLTEVNDINDNSVASYAYDYKGRRISKTTGGVTTKYCYAGEQIIAEYDGNDNLLRKFVYGPGIDEPICMLDVADSNAVYYYHFDGLGSVVALSDNSANIVEKYSYDVFGEPNRTSDVNNPYFFTGRTYDSETGNYYYRARYYGCALGRFLQPDPLGYDDGLNMYIYVHNNPVMNVDPSGLACSGSSCSSSSSENKSGAFCCKVKKKKFFGLNSSCSQHTVYSQCKSAEAACCAAYGNNKNTTVYDAKKGKCCWCEIYRRSVPFEWHGISLEGHAEVNVKCGPGRGSWAADVRPGSQSAFKPHWVDVSVHGFSQGGAKQGRIGCDAADSSRVSLAGSQWLYWYPVHDCRHFASQTIAQMLEMCP